VKARGPAGARQEPREILLAHEELVGLRLEGLGDALEDVVRGELAAHFELADIARGDVRARGELDLRNAERLAAAFHVVDEIPAKLAHRPMLGAATGESNSPRECGALLKRAPALPLGDPAPRARGED